MEQPGREGASLVRQVGTLLWKDTMLEWRTRARLVPTAFFVLLMLLVFNFSFELGGAALTEIGPGVLWGSYVFASLFGLNQTFASERESQCLDALLLSANSPSAIYLAKMLGNVCFCFWLKLSACPFSHCFSTSLSGLHSFSCYRFFCLARQDWLRWEHCLLPWHNIRGFASSFFPCLFCR